MNTVCAIKDQEQIKRVKEKALELGKEPYLYVLLGLNTGLRNSDLLQMRAGDIQREYIIRREQKTGKETEIKLHPAIRAEVLMYLKKMNRADGDLIFPSPHPWADKDTPVSRGTAYRWVKEACRRAGIVGQVGTHTLRKTYGYWFYLTYKDIVALMKHFNHVSEAVTLRYIGYTQKELSRLTEKFKL